VYQTQGGQYVPLPHSHSPNNFNAFPPKVLPLVTIFCLTCGNTHFVNLTFLGFREADWQELTLDDNDG